MLYFFYLRSLAYIEYSNLEMWSIYIVIKRSPYIRYPPLLKKIKIHQRFVADFSHNRPLPCREVRKMAAGRSGSIKMLMSELARLRTETGWPVRPTAYSSPSAIYLQENAFCWIFLRRQTLFRLSSMQCCGSASRWFVSGSDFSVSRGSGPGFFMRFHILIKVMQLYHTG